MWGMSAPRELSRGTGFAEMFPMLVVTAVVRAAVLAAAAGAGEPPPAAAGAAGLLAMASTSPLLFGQAGTTLSRGRNARDIAH